MVLDVTFPPIIPWTPFNAKVIKLSNQAVRTDAVFYTSSLDEIIHGHLTTAQGLHILFKTGEEMTHFDLSHRRTHNLLLISKLLNQRDNVSPITIVLDSLEQPARPLLREYMRRAEVRRLERYPPSRVSIRGYAGSALR